MFQLFWQFFVKEYGGFAKGAVISLLTVVVSLLEGLNIGLLVPLLENLASNDRDSGHWVSRSAASLFDTLGLPFNLGTILLALSILVIGTALLKYFRMIMMEKTGASFTAWIRTKSMTSLMSGDMEYFHRQKVGTLADNLTTQSTRAGSIVVQFTEIGSAMGILIVYLITALLISPLMAVVALGTASIVTISMQYYISKTAIVAVTLVDNENALQNAGIENLSGIHLIKAFLLEPLRGEDFRDNAQAVSNAAYTIGRYRSQMNMIQEISLFAIIGTIVFVGASVLDVSLAVIVALLFILYRSMPRVSSINTRRTQLVTIMASMNNVKKSIDETSAAKVIGGDRMFKDLSKEVVLNNVQFSYDGITTVLNGTSFSIEKGKLTAIAGASGAGKSTLIDLILRFYDPVKGKILVDGMDLCEFDLTSWRKSIGLVSQDIFLFNDTVAYNIGLGRPEFSLDDIKNAAKQAYAQDFIEQFPNGFDTKIGDRGWNLSGGQRQRLSLARAILAKPEFLVLDEATSSLDSESEQLIQKYINGIRGTRTIIVVAHRLSTIQSADKIVVLQDGKIVEDGSWETLLAKDGVLANYHKLQSGNGANMDNIFEPTDFQTDPKMASSILTKNNGNT